MKTITLLHIAHGSISHVFEGIGILLVIAAVWLAVGHWETLKSYWRSRRSARSGR